MATEGLSVQVACRVLGVSESGFYAWRKRSPSLRAIRHTWLTDRVRQVHLASRGTYGARRVRAELVPGQGVGVGHQAVERLMRQVGIQGRSGRPRYRKLATAASATDRVRRQFARNEPDQLWVTAITKPPTREGKVHRAVVLDAYSRRVVGWSIDSAPSASLVLQALGMAIDTRRPTGQPDRDPFRPGNAVHLVGVHATCRRFGLSAVHGCRGHVLQERSDGLILEPRTGRAPGPTIRIRGWSWRAPSSSISRSSTTVSVATRRWIC
jgi:transposase InsO family protein